MAGETVGTRGTEPRRRGILRGRAGSGLNGEKFVDIFLEIHPAMEGLEGMITSGLTQGTDFAAEIADALLELIQTMRQVVFAEIHYPYC